MAACTQTAPADGGPGTGVLSAIGEAESARTRHAVTSTALNHAASFDPTGLSGYLIDPIEDEQMRIEDENERRVDEQVARTIAQAEAMQALSQKLERENAADAAAPARKPVR
jgi:hypothetical protein